MADENGNKDTVSPQPSGASENQGQGIGPEGGASKSPEASAAAAAIDAGLASLPAKAPAKARAPSKADKPAPETAPAPQPTVAEHLQAAADAIDGKIDAAEAQIANTFGDAPLSKAAQRVRAAQESAMRRAIDELHADKERILRALAELPAEVHALEARVIAEIKHLF